MTEFPIVVGVGASAGGVEALMTLVGHLPAGLGVPVLVVLHVSPTSKSVLGGILDRRTRLTVTTATDGAALEADHIYVAPADRHLTVADGRVRLDSGPRVSGHRPAVDPLLRSIARAYGPRGVGVILSGARDDGARGLGAIKAAGGCAFVQDPDEAMYRSMPESALAAVEVDDCLALEPLAERLAALAAGSRADVGGPGAA
ncbi:MAG: two-component system, chemotaxis family, protein-glutamate methylesterase/glutaminase [Solirubrobacteraceae bacterium]|jgi:two-component system chemotaxis response regulator CheB|nr:two-component system, chemotaxis family, protein-glutamate methylesterase/glutaminase [Solirubrobacteraceae bacterium]